MKPIPKEDIQSLERDILFQVLDFFEQYPGRSAPQGVYPLG